MDTIPNRHCGRCGYYLGQGEPYWMHRAEGARGRFYYCEACVTLVRQPPRPEHRNLLTRLWATVRGPWEWGV
jgi:hypothetical protein